MQFVDQKLIVKNFQFLCLKFSTIADRTFGFGFEQSFAESNAENNAEKGSGNGFPTIFRSMQQTLFCIELGKRQK
jgi:hypothetical protein